MKKFERKKTVYAVPKNKKCECGKKITHHHFECDNCHKSRMETSKLRKKAMEKNRRGIE